MSLVPGKKTAAGVDNTARRQWDKDEFRKKAEAREKKVGSWVVHGKCFASLSRCLQ
jgi:hypothetical protein